MTRKRCAYLLETYGNLLIDLQKASVCDEKQIAENRCTQENTGEFILDPSTADKQNNPVVTKAIHLKDPETVEYPIKKTGYYCVVSFGFSSPEYQATVEFRNAYGELQASQIAKLPFYGGLTIVYAVLAMYEINCSCLGTYR